MTSFNILYSSYVEQLLALGAEEVQKCLEVMRQYGIRDAEAGKAISLCPAILFARNADALGKNAEHLHSYFCKNTVRSW